MWRYARVQPGRVERCRRTQVEKGESISAEKSASSNFAAGVLNRITLRQRQRIVHPEIPSRFFLYSTRAANFIV